MRTHTAILSLKNQAEIAEYTAHIIDHVPGAYCAWKMDRKDFTRFNMLLKIVVNYPTLLAPVGIR